MKIYLTGRFSKRHILHKIGQELMLRGHEIVSRWTLPDSDHVVPIGMSPQAADAERVRFALEDIEDIYNCDWMVNLMEEPRNDGRGGRHVEYGMAIALAKRLTIIGPRETVFHHLDQHHRFAATVEHYDTVEEFVNALDYGRYLKEQEGNVPPDDAA